MAGLGTLAVEKHGLELRRDMAIRTLVGGIADEPLKIRDISLSRMPNELREWAIGLMTTDTLLLERVAALTEDVARLRAEVDALETSAKKGART